MEGHLKLDCMPRIAPAQRILQLLHAGLERRRTRAAVRAGFRTLSHSRLRQPAEPLHLGVVPGLPAASAPSPAAGPSGAARRSGLPASAPSPAAVHAKGS